MTGIIGRIWRPFLGCPDCGECEFPERVGALWWQEHPLALVPRIQTWSGQLRLPLVAAELGETFWVLHHQDPAHGAGADFQADRARRRAVGEALERYCAIAPAAAAPLRKVGGGPSLDWPIEHVRLGPGAR